MQIPQHCFLKLMEDREQEKKTKEAQKEQQKRTTEKRKSVRDEKKKQTDLEKEKRAAAKAGENQQKTRNACKGSTPLAGM